MQSDGLPSAEEINIYDTLDERCAVEHFLGKDLGEAEALFNENSLHYQEDLMFMGHRAFCFYVRAAINYLKSDSSCGDSDMANTFCGLLEYRLDYESVELSPVKSELRAAVDYILSNFAKYEIAQAIYGDVAARYRSLLNRLA